MFGKYLYLEILSFLEGDQLLHKVSLFDHKTRDLLIKNANRGIMLRPRKLFVRPDWLLSPLLLARSYMPAIVCEQIVIRGTIFDCEDQAVWLSQWISQLSSKNILSIEENPGYGLKTIIPRDKNSPLLRGIVELQEIIL